jgi:hypothetical protein
MGDSMSLVLSGDTSGTITLDVPAVAGTNTLTLPASTGTVVLDSATQTLTNKTLTSPVIGGTPTGVGVLTSGTSIASTSGTSIDFTSIPSWVKRITVLLNGVSTNGTSVVQVQLGDSGGVETTGYLTAVGLISSANNTTRYANYTTGFATAHGGASADVWRSTMIFNYFGSNIWVGTGTSYNSADSISMASGTKTLTDTLDRVRITTVNGTDTFDAGSVNILYE